MTGQAVPGGAVTFRLQTPSGWLAGWVVWGLALSAVWVRGWTLADGRPWFLFPLVITIVAVITAARYWWGRWSTVTLNAEGTSLEWRSLERRETVSLRPPVRHRLVERRAKGRAPIFGSQGTVSTERKWLELHITAGEPSDDPDGACEGEEQGHQTVVLEARTRRRKRKLRGFAEMVAAISAHLTPEDDQRKVGSVLRSPQPEDVRTRRLNPDAGSAGWRQMTGVVVFAVAVVFLTLGAVLAVPASPSYSLPTGSGEEVQARIVATTDHLRENLPPAGVGGSDEVDVSVRSRDCHRDEEWFWGQGDRVRLTVTAVAQLNPAAVPAVRERIGPVAEVRELNRNFWDYPVVADRDLVPLDIELVDADQTTPGEGDRIIDGSGGVVDLVVSFESVCVPSGDREMLDQVARDHLPQMVALLTGAARA